MLLELIDVAKQYDAVDGAAAPPAAVLRSVKLRVEAGESLAIVGPSGSGKSTLLNIIGTLDRPSAGKVLFEGRDLSALGDRELAALRNRRIGWVFQLHHLLPQLTVLENVLVPTLAGRVPLARQAAPGPGDQCSDTNAKDTGRSAKEPAARPVAPGTQDLSPTARARELLDRVGLGDRLSHRPGQLSGGERQRVAVVRALINRPALLLADEPTGALDHASAVNLAELLVELNRDQGTALIVVTHSMELAARMGRVLELRDGELVAKPG